MGFELQRTKGSEGRAVTGRSSYPVQRLPLCASSTSTSPIISTEVAAAVPSSSQPRDQGYPLFEWALQHWRPFGEIAPQKVVAPRWSPNMVNSSSSCRLPPKSEHHSLSCILHWDCGITATKLDAIRCSLIDRRNVRQHLSFGFGMHRYVPRYRDGRHKPQAILVRARRDHCQRA